MPGSAMSISSPNTTLNTAVAEVLSVFADRLEKADDVKREALEIIKTTVKEHKRIIFNGDNYTEEWQNEARERGLANLKTTVDALPCIVSEKSIRVFGKHGVYSEIELRSRYEILLETYCKTLNIEVQTMAEMASRDIYPAVCKYIGDFAFALNSRTAAAGRKPQTALKELEKLSDLEEKLYEKMEKLKELSLEATRLKKDIYRLACYYCDVIIPAMNELRAVADELEMHIPQDVWPYPSIGDMIFKKV